MLKEKIEQYKDEAIRLINEKKQDLNPRTIASSLWSMTEGALVSSILENPLDLGTIWGRFSSPLQGECIVCGKKSDIILDGVCSAECAMKHAKETASSYMKGYISTAIDGAVNEIMETKTKLNQELDKTISHLTDTATETLKALDMKATLLVEQNVTRRTEEANKLPQELETKYTDISSTLVEKASLISRIQAEKENEIVAKLMKAVTSFVASIRKALGSIKLPSLPNSPYEHALSVISGVSSASDLAMSGLTKAYEASYKALTSGVASKFSLKAGGMYMFVTPKSIIKGDPNIVSLIKVNQSNPVGSVLGALDNTLLPLVSEKLSSLYRPTEADRYKPVGEFASLASKGITALPYVTPLLGLFNASLGGFKMTEEAMPLWENLNVKNLGFLLWSHKEFGSVGSNHFGLPL